MSISLSTPFWGTASGARRERAARPSAGAWWPRCGRSASEHGTLPVDGVNAVTAPEEAGRWVHGFRPGQKRSEALGRLLSADASPRGGVRASARDGGLRLTRRGRFVIFGLPVLAGAVTVAALLMLVLLPGQAQADTDRAVPGRTVVTVSSGDTLWSIAREVDPDGDPRGTTVQIVDLNDLTQSGLTPGQQLVVPVPAGR